MWTKKASLTCSQINTYKTSNTKVIWNKQKMFHNHIEDSPNKTHLQTTNKHLSEVKGGAIFCAGIIYLLSPLLRSGLALIIAPQK